VTDSTGNPASSHVVIVFDVDSASWFFNSRRVAGIRPDADGRYTIRNLPRGEYYVVAFDDVEQGEWYDPSLLQRLTGVSKRISFSDVEKKSHDIVVGSR
jgi:phenylpyruvate tautomerase PptA (4-oxalocrotonate tautomerase family)